MRRFALHCVSLALPGFLLAGCAYVDSPLSGFGGFVGDTHSIYLNPNRPVGDSENLRRVTGREITVDPLLPEPGNVWPGPPPKDPTLEDLERQQNTAQPLGAPAQTPTPEMPPAPHPQPRPAPPRGSSTTPTAEAPVPRVPPLPPVRNTPTVQAAPPPVSMQTPQGPATLNPSGGVQTYTTPTGGQGLVVPNGNGTNTLIGPDGSVQTVPAPR